MRHHEGNQVLENSDFYPNKSGWRNSAGCIKENGHFENDRAKADSGLAADTPLDSDRSSAKKSRVGSVSCFSAVSASHG